MGDDDSQCVSELLWFDLFLPLLDGDNCIDGSNSEDREEDEPQSNRQRY